MLDPSTQSTVIIIAAIGSQLILVVGAIFAGWTALVAKRMATDIKAETSAQTTKIDNVAKDTAVVLGHVNSEKSAAEGRENSLRRENELLKKQLERDERTAQLLAQAAATMAAITQRPNRASDFPQPVPVEEPVQVEVVNQPLLTTPAPKGKG